MTSEEAVANKLWDLIGEAVDFAVHNRCKPEIFINLAQGAWSNALVEVAREDAEAFKRLRTSFIERSIATT